MIVTRIVLKNWRNFREVDVQLGNRVFLVGPNASGKSNFLDAFRFLRDIARDGLEKAISDRGGISKIRCLSARQNPNIELRVELAESPSQETTWSYAITIKQQVRGRHLPILASEEVWKGNKSLLRRPEPKDKEDTLRLTQTHLEQINSNAKFRDIATFFEDILYLHLVPQLVRYPNIVTEPSTKQDPFGSSFLEHVARTPEKTRIARLRKIEKALRIAVPQLKNLAETRDETGKPHLEVTYEHWRAKGAKQREDQFSDGTLRLLGLLWSLLESDSLLLLEEPELSLNAAIVSKLPALMYRLQRQKKRQIVLSTHSADLLLDKGIGGEEVLLLVPSREGTNIIPASSMREIRDLLEGGFSIGEAVLPITSPPKVDQLELDLFK